MAFSKSLLIALLSIYAISAVASSTTEGDPMRQNILVLYDNMAVLTTHSMFLQDLTDMGYVTDMHQLNSNQYKLKKYGEYFYNHLILLCTDQEEKRYLKNSQILDFFDNGGNILFAGDIDTSKAFRVLANKMGVDMEPIGSAVIDYKNQFNQQDSQLFRANNIIPHRHIFGDLQKPVLYRGTALKLTNYENHQEFALLRGNEYSFVNYFAQDKQKDPVLSVGQSLVLVAAVQGRNNARFVATGSLDMFSNELYQKSEFANQQFTMRLLKWNFGESGVIRYRNVYHHLVGSDVMEINYKIYDEIHYSLELDIWDIDQRQWVPYETDDVVMEFKMLDPYYRKTLENIKGTSVYQTVIKAPQQYGVFQFIVNYYKPGYTFLEIATKVPVRPFNHNEYPRYLQEGYPYYTATFGTIFSFFIFFVFFIYDSGTSPQQVSKGRKNQ